MLVVVDGRAGRRLGRGLERRGARRAGRRRSRSAPRSRSSTGRAPKPGTDEVIVGKGIRGRFKGIDLGGTFELRKNRPVKVVGVFDADGSSYESEVWGDIDVDAARVRPRRHVSSVRVRLDSPSDFDAFAATSRADKQLGLEVMREADYYEKQSRAAQRASSACWAS